jgi:hypothetical protein
MNQYQGKRLTIRHCEQPSENDDLETWLPQSWREAIAHLQSNKHPGIYAKMTARRKQFADIGPLRSPDHWNTEGTLPDGKHFYAIKVDKIRAYGWFSSHHKGVFYISHYAYKKGAKLTDENTHRVCKNWRNIEMGYTNE